MVTASSNRPTALEPPIWKNKQTYDTIINMTLENVRFICWKTNPPDDVDQRFIQRLSIFNYQLKVIPYFSKDMFSVKTKYFAHLY